MAFAIKTSTGKQSCYSLKAMTFGLLNMVVSTSLWIRLLLWSELLYVLLDVINCMPPVQLQLPCDI